MMFSITHFGSVCRNNNDAYSDNDLLIICEHKYKKYYFEKFNCRGYSVSIFSERQLHNMKNKGSLFLQHLKLESQILIDVNGSFKTFLDNCDLITPTDDEISNCKKTIEDLNRWHNDDKSIAWKADFLYTSSRDYLIKLLARDGIFAFGLDSIIERYSEHYFINPSLFNSLRLLREIKSAYRNNTKLPKNNEIIFSINDWFEVLEREMNFIFEPQCDANFLQLKKFSSNYERLRYLEVIYISLVDAGYIHNNHDEIVKLILRPNLYHSLRNLKIKTIEGYLNELYELYKLTSFQSNKMPIKSNILIRKKDIELSDSVRNKFVLTNE
ncbi:hypothetical protein [Citrobacter sp. FDAARGOS_156]|uniref:hypothetical protein n=1 Tax=Citrobacter sp. FDAARGOS_156 TaxID=1702170 RepID=UPI001901B0D9|nr:hypothetical protein [Citrobacter sp. FDAARGOS_156]MBJ8885532.1 hypothetical protein [Citrobacter sp. FDAARGOS_156]HED2480545.1 hypothetical protein [Citrobacter youngae]